jgi:hypothetical protein
LIDDEILGEGNSYNAEYWQYDPRLGRRWNVDPVKKEYETPYACFGNNPLWSIDPTGADSIRLGDGTWGWRVENGDSPESIGQRTGIGLWNVAQYNAGAWDPNNSRGFYFADYMSTTNGNYQAYWVAGKGTLWNMDVGAIIRLSPGVEKSEMTFVYNPSFGLGVSNSTGKAPGLGSQGSILSSLTSLTSATSTMGGFYTYNPGANGWWLDNQNQFRPNNTYYGNKNHAAGRKSTAIGASKTMQRVGVGMNALNYVFVGYDFFSGNISGYDAIREGVSTTIGQFGGTYGAAWSIGWELGRVITYNHTYQDIKFYIHENWFQTQGYTHPITGQKVYISPLLEHLNSN